MNEPCCDHMFVHLEGEYRGCWAPCEHQRAWVLECLIDGDSLASDELCAKLGWDRVLMGSAVSWVDYLRSTVGSLGRAEVMVSDRMVISFATERPEFGIVLTCERCGEHEVLKLGDAFGYVLCDACIALSGAEFLLAWSTGCLPVFSGACVSEWLRGASVADVCVSSFFAAALADGACEESAVQAFAWLMHIGRMEATVKSGTDSHAWDLFRSPLRRPMYGCAWAECNLRGVSCRLITWGEYGA